MISLEELSKKQSVVYYTLENAFKNGNVSQSYLFVGNKGSIMLDTAYLVAASIASNVSDMKDMDTTILERMKAGNFLDLVVMDGTDTSIKRGEIDAMMEQFSMTSLESYGKKVYIINAVENATTEGLNALLKFLEEPEDDVYAILISYQVDRLLNTIVSRCQNLKFKPMDVEECVEACLQAGLDEYDSNVLSRIYYDADIALRISDKKNYLEIRDTAMEFVRSEQSSGSMASISVQNFVEAHKKDDGKNDCGLFLDILILYYQEVISPTFEGDTSWEVCKQNEHVEDVPKKLQVVLQTRDDMRRNPNYPLLFDRMLYNMHN